MNQFQIDTQQKVFAEFRFFCQKQKLNLSLNETYIILAIIDVYVLSVHLPNDLSLMNLGLLLVHAFCQKDVRRLVVVK